jgi:hypothetical protein
MAPFNPSAPVWRLSAWPDMSASVSEATFWSGIVGCRPLRWYASLTPDSLRLESAQVVVVGSSAWQSGRFDGAS